MDTIIAVCLISVSVVIVTVGIWLVIILIDVKKMLKVVDTILHNTRDITGAVAKPMNTFSEFVEGFRNGVNIFNSFFKKPKND